MPDQSSAATEHAILQEITGPLAHLPDDPLAIVNADFPTSLRGYDRVAVDEYVAQTRQLVAELQATRSPEAAVRRALERVGEQISGILQRAHETAEQITAQSRSEAEDRLEQARLEALQITRAAEDRVRELDAETDRIWIERERIVADAEDLAAQLQGIAQRAAERFPTDEDEDEVEDASVSARAMLAGTPVEAGAPEHVDDEPVEYEEPAPAPAPAPPAAREPAPAPPAAREPAAREPATPQPSGTHPLPAEDDIEPTVPFAALEPSDSRSGDVGETTIQARTGEEDTARIRPASEAANRRHDR